MWSVDGTHVHTDTHKVCERLRVDPRATSSQRQGCFVGTVASDLLRGRAEGNCGKHTASFSISASLLLVDLNWISVHNQCVAHSVGVFQTHWEVCSFSERGLTIFFILQSELERISLQKRFNPLFSCSSLQTRLQWRMLRRCRRPTSPPQARASLIKMPWDPWCWRYP